ncbi:photosystem reaction center subunit H [Bacillus sp. HMF5848]|uniref:PRC-barrel domain-containing protein n=1 Tax=Bacillus sp. HMF5848 TaxID=2495421 RepID=UPI000F7B2A03|nr:PRC-barrel domain-containing protein [Bacillus sp. HMF5848]RSK28027.1 photosystem reaction center subunit H [Bacillus sp. HMF5848]
MKKSTQIVGLPIISIAAGTQVGKVKSLVINPDKGSVDFLTIEHEDWQVSVKAIPFKKVVGIGEYAVTVESENAVIDLNEIPIANQLVNKKIKITNTKVMTRKGELIGEVNEYFVDEDTGLILGTSLNVQGRDVALASDSVLTFGKDIIIVKEDVASKFLDSVDYLVQQPESNNESFVDDLLPNEHEAALKEVANAIIEETEDEEVVQLKKKQIELLLGKELVKDVMNDNGEVLFHKGYVLQEDDIVKAQEAGPSLVVELSMSVNA